MILLFILLSLILVAINGFFVAAEFAIVKVRRTRLEELAGQGDSAARISIFAVDQLDEYLSATQLGITLVSLGLGWIGEHSFYNLLVYVSKDVFSVNSSAFHAVAIGISFFLITLLHVVLGELVPKSMAIQRAEKITLLVAKPLTLFFKMARPLILTFTFVANSILKLLRFNGEEEAALTEDELKIVMKESHEEGVISESEAQIINRAFEFSDHRAGDLMIPLADIEYLSLSRNFDENVAITKLNNYTRYPLVQNNLDSVIGIVHMKDVLRILSDEPENETFRKCSRPPLFIEPGIRQDQLMKLMNKRRTHLAIVQDPQSKKTLGIVTLEDILEGLVGEIVDEHGN